MYNTQPLSCRGQITLSNIDEICPSAIPNQTSFISMHVPSLVIPWHLLKLSYGKQKIWACLGQITPSKFDENLPIISMHVPSLVKFHWYLLNLSSGNENMGVSQADSIKIWRNLPINNPKPELHNINAHTKFGGNPLMFTQVIIRKWKTDRRTDDWQTHGRSTWNHNTAPPPPPTIVWRGIKNNTLSYTHTCTFYVKWKYMYSVH